MTQNFEEPLTVHRLSTPRWNRERVNFAPLTIKQTETASGYFTGSLSGALVRAWSRPLSARCRHRTRGTSARLFYERAAALGNAQAAVRLGASYDPAFLAQTGLKSIRGDLTAAQYWYQRARDLAASEAGLVSIGQAIDPTGAAEKAVTESFSEIVPERTITGDATPQSAESESLIDKTAKPTRPIGAGFTIGYTTIKVGS